MSQLTGAGPSLCLGIDLQAAGQVAALQAPTFEFVFTASERDYAQSRPDTPESLAAIFAIKEAVLKATDGLPGRDRLGPRDIVVNHGPTGAPRLELPDWLYVAHGGPIESVSVTASHSHGFAVAAALVVVQPPDLDLP